MRRSLTSSRGCPHDRKQLESSIAQSRIRPQANRLVTTNMIVRGDRNPSRPLERFLRDVWPYHTAYRSSTMGRVHTSQKEYTMSEDTTDEKGSEQSGADPDGQRNTIQQLGRTLDEWRSKIDHLVVQLDLADLDVRDEIRRRLDTTQNVYLAARSRLSDARSDADTNLSSLRSGLEQLLRDLRDAYDAAEAVVRRSRQQH